MPARMASSAHNILPSDSLDLFHFPIARSHFRTEQERNNEHQESECGRSGQETGRRSLYLLPAEKGKSASNTPATATPFRSVEGCLGFQSTDSAAL
jgi:hypothetical protein